MPARKPLILARRHRARVTFKKYRRPEHDSPSGSRPSSRRSSRSWSSYSSRPPSVTTASSSSDPSISDPLESEEETEELSWEDHAAIHGPRLEVPTGQIRLLQILGRRDPWDEIVHCHMFKTCLFDEMPGPPLFNALSYVWGDKKNLKFIVINGKIMTVRSNLESALRHFRDHHIGITQGLPLWVDALCINQDDTEECNQQVKMMGKIYQRAHKVLPWLGEGNFDTDWLLPLLDNEDFRSGLEAIRTKDPEENAALEPWAMRAVVVFQRDLLCRPWWTRVWVIQELLLATQDPILIVGKYYISWSRVVAVFRYTDGFANRVHYHAYYNMFRCTYAYSAPFHTRDRQGVFERPPVAVLNHLRSKILQYNVPLCSMYVSLEVLTKWWATHPADYVYALQGLASGKEKITVDYSKHPLEIFHDFMCTLWTSMGFTAHMLAELNYQRQAESQELSGIPSWVPDLSQQHEYSILRYPHFTQPWRTSDARVSQDRRVLHLRGIYLDKVSRIWCAGSKGLLKTSNSFNLVRDLDQGFRGWLSSNNNYRLSCAQSPDELKARFIRRLLGYSSSEVKREYIWHWVKLWDRICDTDGEDIFSELASVPMEGLQTVRSAREVAGDFWSSLSTAVANTAFFETASGLIGMGPAHSEAVDCLVFPFGMTCPWVVRPVDSTHPEAHEQATMIGPADVERLMFDEGEDEKVHGLLDKAVETGVFKVIDIELV